MVEVVLIAAISLFSLLSLVLITYCDYTGKIYLSVEYPIVLGERIILFCNTSTSGENKITWMKGNNVVMHYGASLDNQKYKEEHNADGVSLIVSNAQISDVNVSYTCITETSSSQIFIEPTSEDVLVPLNDENVNIVWNLTTSGILTSISFKEVFPIPKCFLNFNESLHLVKEKMTFHQHGLVYNGTMDMFLRFNSPMCNEFIKVVCRVGRKIFTVGNTTVHVGCDEKYVPDTNKVNYHVYRIVAGIVLPILFFSCVICVIIFRKLHLTQGKECCSTDKDSVCSISNPFGSKCFKKCCFAAQHAEEDVEPTNIPLNMDYARKLPSDNG